jgi:hypothetical protein
MATPRAKVRASASDEGRTLEEEGGKGLHREPLAILRIELEQPAHSRERLRPVRPVRPVRRAPSRHGLGLGRERPHPRAAAGCRGAVR